jgi:hypothetical protein
MTVSMVRRGQREVTVYVNTDGLHSGANTSYIAAGHAYEGAGTLSRSAVNSGIV